MTTTTASMQFRLLGPLEVQHDGRVLPLGAGKQRALLAMLLLHANEVVSTDRLIDALWGDAPPERAGKALQVYVSQLRKALATPRILVTRPPGYVLELPPEAVDFARFERLSEEGRRALVAGAPERAAARLQDALALWRGAPLADLTFEAFAQPHIARLEEQRLAALEDRIEAELALGRHAALVGELEGLVAEHPLRERLRGQLILALYRSGRQADALAAFQDARRTLVDELGIEPSPQLHELERRILQQDPALDAVSMRMDTAERPDPPSGIFVGREAELEQLRAGLDAAVAGRGGLVLLVGEPGIGKSRLADEVARQARARGAHVLIGRCWEAGGAPAYWPWVQSLRSYVEQSDPDTLRAQLPAGAPEVAQLVPELRAFVAEPPDESLDAELARFRLFDSSARFLRNAATGRPLFIFLDDLHAADEPSLLLLRFLAGELADSHIFVLGTYRDVDPTVRDPLASTLTELVREQVTQRINLTGLTDADVARYIELSAGEAPAPELVRIIHSETEGNPLFVGEVVRLLAAEGRLTEANAGALWMLGIPQGVREVIGRRLARLSAECTRVLTIASVVGREFGLNALERLTELSPDGLLEVVDEALTARVLTSAPGARGRLRFAHALIRETLYEGLSTPRRVRLHRRVGEVLEGLYVRDPEPHLAELAHHFFEGAAGGDVEKALEYARRAAERALRLLAYEEAARHYELALQVFELEEPIDAVDRCELLLGLGEAQARAGNEAASTRTFLEAAELARSSGAPEHLARAALGYSGRFVWMVRGLDQDVVPLLEDALSGLGREPSALRARVLARLAGALRDEPEDIRRAALSAEAVDVARELGDRSALAYALDGRYAAVWDPDNAEERLPITDEILQLASEVGDRERAIQGHYYRAFALLELGRISDVHAELNVMSGLATALRQPAQRWHIAVVQAILALFEGRFDEARATIPEAFALGGTMRAFLPAASFAGQRFMLHKEQGQLAELTGETEEVLEKAPSASIFRCIVANLYAELGRSDDARAAVDELAAIDFAVRVANDTVFGWCLLAEVCSSLGNPAYARRLYELLQPHGHLNAVCHPVGATGSVARYLGLLAATLAGWHDADRHFADALEMNTRMGARPWVAHTQHDYARMLLARGEEADAQRAEQLLANALETARELGMRRLEERITSGSPA